MVQAKYVVLLLVATYILTVQSTQFAPIWRRKPSRASVAQGRLMPRADFARTEEKASPPLILPKSTVRRVARKVPKSTVRLVARKKPARKFKSERMNFLRRVVFNVNRHVKDADTAIAIKSVLTQVSEAVSKSKTGLRKGNHTAKQTMKKITAANKRVTALHKQLPKKIAKLFKKGVNEIVNHATGKKVDVVHNLKKKVQKRVRKIRSLHKRAVIAMKYGSSSSIRKILAKLVRAKKNSHMLKKNLRVIRRHKVKQLFKKFSNPEQQKKLVSELKQAKATIREAWVKYNDAVKGDKAAGRRAIRIAHCRLDNLVNKYLNGSSEVKKCSTA